MEALYLQPRVKVEDGEYVVLGQTKAPLRDTEEGRNGHRSKPPSPRKVSFADAFGLDLVKVMEFDAPEPPGPEPGPEVAGGPIESEFNLSCLFSVPSSPEELDQRLEAQNVELESVELLPGTTTLRGIVRVVNLCYDKCVRVRMTLDSWASSFDLSADYVPGSSDKKTDRFAFTYDLVPPFGKEGVRLEFCLRYDTSVGTFWANNKEMNYVLFCHQKQHVDVAGVKEEDTGYEMRRSCLKSNRRRSAQEKIWEASITGTVIEEAEEAGRMTLDRAEIQSLLFREKHRPVVDNVKSRQRAARLARVQECLSPKRQRAPQGRPRESADDRGVPQPPWGDLCEHTQRKRDEASAQVLTYHQIPLLTLDWNNDQGGAFDAGDIWTGRPKTASSKASAEHKENAPCAVDVWETFCHDKENTADIETPVCDAWQAFLNGPPGCTDHSGVPESEWLQNAASVSPSSDRATPHGASGQGGNFQAGKGTAASVQTLHERTSAARQTLPADTEAGVEGPRGDNLATQEAHSLTDTSLEFSPRGPTPVSGGSGDSSAECHKAATLERAKGEIIGALGRDQASLPHTADSVTSPGESETTDMTAPESPNASAADRIWRPDEGLSSSRVPSTLHNATDDTLAFTGTMRAGTKDGESFVSATARRGGVMNNCTENEARGETFGSRETAEGEISQRHQDERQQEEVGPNDDSGKPSRGDGGDGGERMRPARSHADEPHEKWQTREDDYERSQEAQSEIKLDEWENKDGASNNKDLGKCRETDWEPSDCTTGQETERVIDAAAGNIPVLNEKVWQDNEEALTLGSSWQRGDTLIISQGHDKQLGQRQAGKELRIHEENDDATLTQTQGHVLLKSERGEVQQEINKAQQSTHTEESREPIDHATLRPFETDKLNPSEVVRTRRIDSREDTKGHDEDEGHKMNAEEVETGANVAERGTTSTELRRRHKTWERTEEDMSQRDKDERMGVIRELEIEAPGELMGDVEDPRGERENAPAQSTERELPAEVESPSRVECEKLSEGTKDPITADSPEALKVIELALEEAFAETFGEDLFFDKATHIVGGMEGLLSDRTHLSQDCRLVAKKDEAFDSGLFSLTELPTDPDAASLCLQTSSSESSEKRSRSPATAPHAPFLSEPPTDSDSSARLGGGPEPVLGQPSTGSVQSSAEDKESHSRVKQRAVARRETAEQTDDPEIPRKEGPCEHSGAAAPSERPTGSVTWWALLYVLGQITRLVICVLAVAGCFLAVVPCEHPSFVALSVFVVGCWISKWKRHRAPTNEDGVPQVKS